MGYFSRADQVRKNSKGELQLQMIEFILRVYPERDSFELINFSFNRLRQLYNQAKKENEKSKYLNVNTFLMTYDEYNEMSYGR